MSEYALVDSGIVRDVIVADAGFISAHGDEVKAQRGFSGGAWELTPDKVGIGYSYANSVFCSPASGSYVPAIDQTPARLLASCHAIGGSLSYQWMKGGDEIEGATSASYSKDSPTSGDSGDYSCVVTGNLGSVTSPIVSIVVP